MPTFKFDTKKIVFEMKTKNTDSLVKSTKQWIHCMDKRQCETHFLLLQQALRHIHEHSDPSKTYNFGPTVMRMFHYHNLPDQALKVNLD